MCKGSLQKTRGEVCKVSKKMWRCIAVLLKLVSPIFYTFLWWALHKNISSNGTTTAFFKNRIEKTRNDAFFTFNLCCQWTQTTKFWTFPSNRNSNKEKVELRWRWGTLGPAWLDPLGGLGLLLPVSDSTTPHIHHSSISTSTNSANKDTHLDEDFNCGENCIVPFCTLRFQISILGWWREEMRQILLIGQDRGGGWTLFLCPCLS